MTSRLGISVRVCGDTDVGAPKYTAGKYAIGLCDICSFRYKLNELKSVYRRGMDTHLLACPKC